MAALMVVNVGSRCLKEDGSEVEVWTEKGLECHGAWWELG
jgi:hypothetical protein